MLASQARKAKIWLKKFGASCKKKLDSKELTQQAVEAATGVRQTTVSNFIRKGTVRCDAFARFIAFLGGRIVLPGEEQAAESADADRRDLPAEHVSELDSLRRRVAELKDELAKAQADAAVANARAEAYRDALALARPVAPAHAPARQASDETRIQLVTPRPTQCSDGEER